METVELAFDEFGKGNGAPLIILHGFLASRRNWRLIGEKLAAHYHVYVPDMRNHGASPHQPRMDYPAMAADVLAFMERQKLSNAHVLGHSMGGKIAMWLALQHPERVNKLVVVDIAPKAYTHTFDAIFSALRGLPLAEIENRKQAEERLADAIPELSYRQFLLQNLVLQGGEYRWRIDLAIFENAGASIAGFPEVTDLPACERPALFVAGADSHYLDKTDVDGLFPRAEFQVIEGAGHWVHSQKPDFFMEVVENFLQTGG